MSAFIPFDTSKDSLLSNETRVKLEQKMSKAKPTESELPVLQTVKSHYNQAANYWTYRLSSRLQKNDVKFSSYSIELIKKLES